MTAVLSLLTGGWGKVVGYAAAALAAVGAVLGFVALERHEGAQAQRTSDLEAQEAAQKQATRSDAAVDAMTTKEAHDALYNDFGRR